MGEKRYDAVNSPRTAEAMKGPIVGLYPISRFSYLGHIKPTGPHLDGQWLSLSESMKRFTNRVVSRVVDRRAAHKWV